MKIKRKILKKLLNHIKQYGVLATFRRIFKNVRWNFKFYRFDIFKFINFYCSHCHKKMIPTKFSTCRNCNRRSTYIQLSTSKEMIEDLYKKYNLLSSAIDAIKSKTEKNL